MRGADEWGEGCTQIAKPIGRQHRLPSADTQHRRAAKLVKRSQPSLATRPRGCTQLTHKALLRSFLNRDPTSHDSSQSYWKHERRLSAPWYS